MEEKELSFLVMVSFILLFFVFVFMISPSAEETSQSTGYVSLAGLSFNFSSFYLILVSILLLILLAVAFIVYKKVKAGKKIIIPGNVIQQEEPKPAIDEKAIEEEKKLSNKDIDELFSLDEKKEPEKQEKAEVKEEKKEGKAGEESKQEPKQEVKEEKINLIPLKNTISSLLKQGHSKQQILVYLNSKGWKTENIRQALELINEDNLKDYIKKALSQGFKKEQVIEALTTKGWSKEKVLKLLE